MGSGSGTIHSDVISPSGLSLYAPLASPPFTGVSSFPAGTAAAPSIQFGGEATGAYLRSAGVIAFGTSGVERAYGDASGNWVFGSATTSAIYGKGKELILNQAATTAAACLMYQLANNGSMTWSSGNSGTAGGNMIAFGGTHASAGLIQFRSGSTVNGSVSGAGVWTIGTGTSTEHALNTLLGTNGAAVMTMTNGPAAASAGNPVGWEQVTINGTTRYRPFW